MRFFCGKRAVLVLLVVAAVMMLPLAAQATLVEVPIANPLGSTATNTIISPTIRGVTAFNEWDNGGFSITALVTRLADSLNNYVFRYDYTINVPQKGLSHWIIAVTPGAPNEDFWYGGVDVRNYFNTSTKTLLKTWDPGPSNPGLPASFYGIKFDTGGEGLNYFTLFSLNKPVWADFYAKDGKTGGTGVYAHNAGFGNPDPGSGYAGLFTIGPNSSGGQVPIPPSVLLMGSGLLGLGLIGWRRRK